MRIGCDDTRPKANVALNSSRDADHTHHAAFLAFQMWQ